MSGTRLTRHIECIQPLITKCKIKDDDNDIQILRSILYEQCKADSLKRAKAMSNKIQIPFVRALTFKEKPFEYNVPAIEEFEGKLD